MEPSYSLQLDATGRKIFYQSGRRIAAAKVPLEVRTALIERLPTSPAESRQVGAARSPRQQPVRATASTGRDVPVRATASTGRDVPVRATASTGRDVPVTQPIEPITPQRLAALPRDLQRQLLLRFDPDEILEWCAMIPTLAGICDDPAFWAEKEGVDRSIYAEAIRPYELYRSRNPLTRWESIPSLYRPIPFRARPQVTCMVDETGYRRYYIRGQEISRTNLPRELRQHLPCNVFSKRIRQPSMLSPLIIGYVEQGEWTPERAREQKLD
jgi:hypothetical protein